MYVCVCVNAMLQSLSAFLWKKYIKNLFRKLGCTSLPLLATNLVAHTLTGINENILMLLSQIPVAFGAFYKVSQKYSTK